LWQKGKKKVKNFASLICPGGRRGKGAAPLSADRAGKKEGWKGRKGTRRPWSILLKYVQPKGKKKKSSLFCHRQGEGDQCPPTFYLEERKKKELAIRTLRGSQIRQDAPRCRGGKKEVGSWPSEEGKNTSPRAKKTSLLRLELGKKKRRRYATFLWSKGWGGGGGKT